ncbi:hypothetical protein BECAL_00237 [Bellilinea caldifistulae]|nr:hypothetical protein BECAL_00237 [Bellilinea caldifistulae]
MGCKKLAQCRCAAKKIVFLLPPFLRDGLAGDRHAACLPKQLADGVIGAATGWRRAAQLLEKALVVAA